MGTAATTTTIQRTIPMRWLRGNPATASAATHPAIAGHWKFIAANGNRTAAAAASATGTRRAPTSNSDTENHLLSTPAITHANVKAAQTMASTYQPSEWNAPAWSAPSSGWAPLRHWKSRWAIPATRPR